MSSMISFLERCQVHFCHTWWLPTVRAALEWGLLCPSTMPLAGLGGLSPDGLPRAYGLLLNEFLMSYYVPNFHVGISQIILENPNGLHEIKP